MEAYARRNMQVINEVPDEFLATRGPHKEHFIDCAVALCKIIKAS
jgi:hypothetical protein